MLKNAVLAAIACLAATARPDTLSASDRALFEWFDSVGYAGICAKPFVLVPAVTNGMVSGRRLRPLAGFLIELKESEGKILTVSLVHVRRTAPKPVAANEPSVVKDFLRQENNWNADLDAYAQEQLSLGQYYARDPRSAFWFSLEDFVTARACDLRGLTGTRDQLLKGLHETALKHHLDFATAVKKWVDDAQLGQIHGEFGDVSETRADILKLYDRYLQHFPSGPNRVRALAERSLLEQTISENRTHADWLSTPLDNLPKSQKIDALVFRLRELSAERTQIYVDQPGSGWRFPVDKDERSMLEGYGFTAVPQLIAALNDKRFTRSASGVTALTVGDVALGILNRIAGHNFVAYDELPSEAGTMPKAKAAVEKWWRLVESKGEATALVAFLKTDVNNAILAGERLAHKYPSAAAGPLADAYFYYGQAPHQVDDYTRSTLLDLFAPLRNPAVKAALKRVMLQGQGKSSKLWSVTRAAAYYYPYDPDRIVAFLRKKVEDATVDPMTTGIEGEPIRFLAQNCGVRGVKALLEVFQQAAPDIRSEIIDGLDPRPLYDGFALSYRADLASSARLRDRLALQGLYDTRLSQRDENEGLRVCDHAIAYFYHNEQVPESFEAVEAARVRLIRKFRGKVPSLDLHRGTHPTRVLSVATYGDFSPDTKHRLEALVGTDLDTPKFRRILDLLHSIRTRCEVVMLKRFTDWPGVYLEFHDLPPRDRSMRVDFKASVGGESGFAEGGSAWQYDYNENFDFLKKVFSAPSKVPVGFWIRISPKTSILSLASSSERKSG